MITQTEADSLIAMEKRFVELLPVTLRPGKNQTLELVGYPDSRERFVLDLWRGVSSLRNIDFKIGDERSWYWLGLN